MMILAKETRAKTLKKERVREGEREKRSVGSSHRLKGQQNATPTTRIFAPLLNHILSSLFRTSFLLLCPGQ